MERLLHYVWQHKLFPLKALQTTCGEALEVIDAGLRNGNAGPDFFNAKVKIGTTLWVGNVELHLHSSDWSRHHHDENANYDNIILHVAEDVDTPLYRADGSPIPQLELPIPKEITQHYEELLHEEAFPPCYRIIPSLSKLTVHSWMSALQVERLEAKAAQIQKMLDRTACDWENAFFVTLARSFGFGINGDAFEEWANRIPPSAVGKHRDDLFQIEAFFLGQAGLLEDEMLAASHREEAEKDGYFAKLQKEYRFLAHKFTLTPMNGRHWNFLRLRPQNFPHIRLVQLAVLYNSCKASFSEIIECTTLQEARQKLETSVTPYWESHYSFGSESQKQPKIIQRSSLHLLIINAVVPMLFTYGRSRMNEPLCERAFRFLEELPAENNRYTRIWTDIGLPVNSAADSQGLIELRKTYCDRKDCLRCRFGYEYLSNK
ncbi:MAG: DUF2851 family protein [Bacteroidaceae bacterium]